MKNDEVNADNSTKIYIDKINSCQKPNHLLKELKNTN